MAEADDLLCIVTLPGFPTTCGGLVEFVTLTKTPALLPSGSKAARFTMLGCFSTGLLG